MANYTDKEVEQRAAKRLKNLGKPSAGLSKKKKSTVAKKARAGKDIGKPGKKFEEVAAKHGKKVAAAALWRDIKR